MVEDGNVVNDNRVSVGVPYNILHEFKGKLFKFQQNRRPFKMNEWIN